MSNKQNVKVTFDQLNTTTRVNISSLHGPECQFSTAGSADISVSQPGQEQEEFLDTLLDKDIQVDTQTREVRLRESRPGQPNRRTDTCEGSAWCALQPDVEVSLSPTTRPIFRGAQPQNRTWSIAVDLHSSEISQHGGTSWVQVSQVSRGGTWSCA